MTAEPNDVEVSDLIIETGPLRDGLATAVRLLQREWTLEELDEPAEQTAAAALVARQVPGLDRVLGRARDTLNRKGAAILRGVPAESDVMLVAITSILGPVEAIEARSAACRRPLAGGRQRIGNQERGQPARADPAHRQLGPGQRAGVRPRPRLRRQHRPGRRRREHARLRGRDRPGTGQARRRR